MAEIELRILNRQCLDRKIVTVENMKSETDAWQIARNKTEAAINWQFATKDAGGKLKRLYQSINN
jgi:hypothetical protein